MNSQIFASVSEPQNSCAAVPTLLAVPPRIRRVLIADDDKQIRHFLAGILIAGGFDVSTAEDGEEAWKLLVLDHYDLLISDNEMPRLIGIKLVERIRAAGMNLPIIIVTGSRTFQLTPAHMSFEIAEVIRKPIDISDFLKSVEAALGISRGNATPDPASLSVVSEKQTSKPPHRVLVVDDDSIVRDSLAAVLELEGYDVDEASSGRSAIFRAIESPPDLVLLDLNMPRCDGWTAFNQLDVLAPLVPVIVITARPNQYGKAVQLKVDAFMEKPLNIPVLVHAIKNLTDDDENRRVRRTANPEFVTQLLDNNYL